MDLSIVESTESKWREVRRVRDELIRRTDWTQMADSPISAEDKEKVAEYRQALRDIPQNISNPDEVVFPKPPIDIY